VSDLITICIPTYRRPSMLLHAIHSCLIQDYRPLEIDISDDSPSDASELLVRSIPLPPGITLRYWRNSPALKQARNVNKLFTSARGSRLMLLHDDDALLPGAISALSDAFSLSNSVVASFGIQEVIAESGEILPRDTAELNSACHRTPDEAGLQPDTIKSALWWQFPNNAYLIETALAAKVGYRGEEIAGDSCDFDFALRVAYASGAGQFAFIDRYTAQYRLCRVSVRSGHGCCWIRFDQVEALQDLTPEQREARDQLLYKTSEEAVVDNVHHGRRRRALQIFRSPFYPRRVSIKPCYHLALIAIPQLGNLRDRFRDLSGSH
jgi:glycosyltransferase involved in cell wall biosynthesis